MSIIFQTKIVLMSVKDLEVRQIIDFENGYFRKKSQELLVILYKLTSFYIKIKRISYYQEFSV